MIKVVIIGSGGKSLSDILSVILAQHTEKAVTINADLYSDLKPLEPVRVNGGGRKYDKLACYQKIGQKRSGYARTVVKWHRI